MAFPTRNAGRERYARSDESRRTASEPEAMHPSPYGEEHPARPDPYSLRLEEEAAQAASTASGLNLLLGVWLVISPWILDYANVVPGFGGFWNEVAVGATIAFLALARVAFPRNFATLSWVNAVLGAWLIAAPWVLGYNDTYDIPKAFWNDIATGAAIIILAFSSFGATRVAHLRGRQAIQGS